eukprot:COSAG02_NODE_330_length_24501_cov_39.465850_26_plen_171_part_00
MNSEGILLLSKRSCTDLRPPGCGDQQSGIAGSDLRAADNIVSAGETQVREGYTARAPPRAATPPVTKAVQGATGTTGTTQLTEEERDAGYVAAWTCTPDVPEAPASDEYTHEIKLSRSQTRQKLRVYLRGAPSDNCLDRVAPQPTLRAPLATEVRTAVHRSTIEAQAGRV